VLDGFRMVLKILLSHTEDIQVTHIQMDSQEVNIPPLGVIPQLTLQAMVDLVAPEVETA